jgi:hypothetical protein
MVARTLLVLALAALAGCGTFQTRERVLFCFLLCLDVDAEATRLPEPRPVGDKATPETAAATSPSQPTP